MASGLNFLGVVVLAAFASLAVRAALLAGAARRDRPRAVGPRVLAASAWAGLAVLYALLGARALEAWTAGSALGAAATAAVVLGSVAFRGRPGRWGWPRPAAAVGHLCLVLALLLAAALTLMGAGFLALTADRPVLVLEVTGETGSGAVRWTPPGRAPREEVFRTHRVVFRVPGGAPVAEAWLYGDEVAVKGRVVRLSPILNAAGVPNLFELRFAHNGYGTAERHEAYPHTAIPLPPSGPLAVHPWWRPVQTWLLEGWERNSREGRPWAVRSVTVESTYFPLVDAQGNPVRQTYRVVLTPGGLSGG